MAHKAGCGEMTHLLIDRFRFDSFAPHSDEAGSNLLTRFGQIVYLFFLVTPPAALVERAWNRGLDVGRYKAVDDTLAHAVEAYSGMPDLFFTWVARRDKRVHFEFLDNTVARGAPPRAAAFGWNDTLNVLDVSCLLDIERFRKVDVDARSPRRYPDPRRSPRAQRGFLAVYRPLPRRELRRPGDRSRVVGRAGKRVGGRQALHALTDPDIRRAVGALPALLRRSADRGSIPAIGDDERRHTVGDWAPGAARLPRPPEPGAAVCVHDPFRVRSRPAFAWSDRVAHRAWPVCDRTVDFAWPSSSRRRDATCPR
jgi:hypothetical protein